MRGAAWAVVCFLLPQAPAPAAPLPSLPSLGRVRVEVGKDRSLVLHELNLPRGEYKGGDLDLFVSFGTTVPTAVDARIVAVPDGELAAPEGEPGESLVLERAPRRPANAHVVIGRPTMAGVVVKLKEAAFRRATTPGGMAQIRIRELVPVGDAARPLPVRLGVVSGQPITVLRLELAALAGEPPLKRPEAHLCGPEADDAALTLTPRPKEGGATILPFLATRHASDDVCFGWTR